MLKITVTFCNTEHKTYIPITHKETVVLEVPDNAQYLDIKERIKYISPKCTAIVQTPKEVFNIPSFLR